ncbi:VWA domain-containing protein [Phosphitispora sp. TUW77]|uniref:VWA domain-containing protein n=1 Tax=Phosphitispora sp. TUW77 TaxID=3152361 RepID=UPI003AB5CF56
MDKNILQFARLLRKAGIKVSHSEVMEALRALALTGIEKHTFFNILSATLIKEQADMRVFEKIFELYFSPEVMRAGYSDYSRSVSLINSKPTTARKGCDMIPGTEKGRTTGFGQGRGLATAEVENFVQVIQAGVHEEMLALVKKGVEGIGELFEEDLEDTKDTIRQVKIFLEWNMGVYKLESTACDVDEKTRFIWQDRLKSLEDMLHKEIEKKLITEFGAIALEKVLARENINQLDFYKLSSMQVAEIKQKISKLAYKLASRVSLRKKRSKRGQLDLARTIRKSMSYGGVPIKPAYRNHHPTRLEMVILFDLSSSVKIFSEFILQLVYSIQNKFIHVRSFVFVDTPDEITGFFINREIEDGIKDVYNLAKFSKTPFSDYGQMFKDFNEKYLDILNKKVTLLIIGDARNNYHRDHADCLLRMCQEAKKTIWLNPEPAEKWDEEDSLISLYGVMCDQVFECRNLDQLEMVSRKII